MTVRQTYYDRADDFKCVFTLPEVYNNVYLRIRILECISNGHYFFPYLQLAVAKSAGIKQPAVRELNKLFREKILFEPKEDILCQNYQNSNESLLLRVREYVLVQDYVRAMQLYLVYLCNPKK